MRRSLFSVFFLLSVGSHTVLADGNNNPCVADWQCVAISSEPSISSTAEGPYTAAPGETVNVVFNYTVHDGSRTMRDVKCDGGDQEEPVSGTLSETTETVPETVPWDAVHGQTITVSAPLGIGNYTDCDGSTLNISGGDDTTATITVCVPNWECSQIITAPTISATPDREPYYATSEGDVVEVTFTYTANDGERLLVDTNCGGTRNETITGELSITTETIPYEITEDDMNKGFATVPSGEGTLSYVDCEGKTIVVPGWGMGIAKIEIVPLVQAGWSLNVSINESSGARHRKIALNGAPMPDGKPQTEEESDVAKEETYIDALTAALRHDVSDIYIPLTGTDLVLQVRRNYAPATWGMYSGFLPEEKPNSAFGASWSSNLGTHIEFIRRSAGPTSREPDMAIVTDENGQQYNFAILYLLEAIEETDPEDETRLTYHWPVNYEWECIFVPVPSSLSDQDALNCSLTRNSEGILEFKKKFGAVSRYQMTTVERIVTSNAPDDGDKHTYARLIEVEDRYKNKIQYHYESTNESLIPDEIQQVLPSGLGPKITIHVNAQGLVEKVVDPNGGEIVYAYDSEPYQLAFDSQGTLSELATVTDQESAVTTYEYAITEETHPFINDLGSVVMHHDLTSITDPLENSYEFEYRFNTVRKSYADGEGYYRRTGLQSEVKSVLLPGGAKTEIWLGGEAKLEIDYVNWDIAGSGSIHTTVKDVQGNFRVYEFSNPQVESMRDFRSTYVDTGDFDAPKMFYFLDMAVKYYDHQYNRADPSASTPLGEESFKFSHKAGMAPVEVVDFSGNVTQYEYEDEYSGGLTQPDLIYLNAQISGFHSDPTKETDALNGVKEFTYTTGRIMSGIIDQLGNQTVYTVDTLGRRTSETITPDGATDPISRTLFDFADTYAHPGHDHSAAGKNFMTRKTVQKLSTATLDPAWVVDLVTVYIPDSKGRLWKEIVDPDGLALTTTYEYDANNNKRFVTDPRANVTEFQYDDRNRLVKKINPPTLDPDTGLPVATTMEWVYDARGNKVKQIDENGVATLHQYDALNRLVHTATDMNGNGIIDLLSDDVTPDRSIDLVTSHTYNQLNARLTTTDPRGTVTKFEYDDLQRLVKKIDDHGAGRLNHETTYAYDITKNPGGSAFDSSGFKPTTATDPRGYATEITYDKLYRPVLERTEYKTGVFAETHKVYDAVGNLTTVTDPLGTVTETIYDALRRPVSVTAAHGTTLAATTTTDYASTGLAWRTIDPLERETLTEYDAAGRPVKTIAPAVDDALNGGASTTPITETHYDAAGNVIAVINPLGEQTDYTYDARNRRLTEEQPAVIDATTGLAARPLLTTTYDAVGNVVATQDARGNITTTEHDPARRPHTITAPLVAKPDATTAHPVTTMAYDAAGNVLTLTDANGNVTTNTYDALGRLLTTTQSPTTDPADDITVTNEYDPAGNRTAVIDGKTQRTEFTYDGLNRNTSIKDPANRTVTFTYDAMNKTARVDSLSQRTEYTYDALHRLTDVAYIGRSQDDRAYAYDLVGQLLTVTEPGKAGGLADVAYTYDALGRQLTETSNGHTHAYTYDLANNRITVTYGGTGTILTSAYDALNRLTTLSELPDEDPPATPRVTTYGYDLAGNRVLLELPNGEETETTYDALNRRTAIVTTKTGGGSLLELEQAYDLVGNVARITETYPGSTLSGRTVTNTYDGVNRLTVETAAESAQTVETTYTFDKANNRTDKSVETTTGTGTGTTTVATTYAYNTLNQLETATTGSDIVTFTYDLNGNRVGRSAGGQADIYYYDYENRLLGLAKHTAPVANTGTYNYVYDYRTRRVERRENGISTKTVFSGGVSVQEYLVAGGADPGQTLTAEYIRGSDWGGGVGGLLYSIRDGQPSFKHYNSRGDVITATDATGATTWEATYEAFGTRTQEIGSTQDRQKANTKEEDPTGLLNEGFRYRDLETGTFITRDPLGFVDGPNMYAYVVQNPWSKFDPEGLHASDGKLPEDSPLLQATLLSQQQHDDGRLSPFVTATPVGVSVQSTAKKDLERTNKELWLSQGKAPNSTGGYTPDGLDVAADAARAALDSGNRYAGAVVEAFKFWKWPQATADFVGGHVASAIYEPGEYFNPLSKTNVDYVKWQLGTAEGYGSLAGTLMVGTVAPQVPNVRIPHIEVPVQTKILTAQILSALDDGTVRGVLPDPRKATPPEPPPAIIQVIDPKPAAGAGASGTGKHP